MKKIYILALLLLVSTAHAAFTPTQLAQLVKTPDKFKATEKYTDSKVNSGFLVYNWQWGSGITPDVELRRSPKDLTAWELSLSGDSYGLAKVAPQRKLLAVVGDDVMRVTTSIYSVTGGPLKGAYVLEDQYRDGSGGFSIQTKRFALAAAQGSEFSQNTSTKLLSYPLYGLLGAKAAMCALPEVTCK